jgi:hypothetical protein
MAGWFERIEQRRRELAEGADADLMNANRRRYKIAFGLIGLAAILGWVDARLPHGTLRIVLRSAAVASGLAGIVMARWAQAEHKFLTDPDPERPPSIFKE